MSFIKTILKIWTSVIGFNANTYNSKQVVTSPNVVGTLSVMVGTLLKYGRYISILDLNSKKI